MNGDKGQDHRSAGERMVMIVEGVSRIRLDDSFEAICSQAMELLRDSLEVEGLYLSLIESPMFCEKPFWGMAEVRALNEPALERIPEECVVCANWICVPLEKDDRSVWGCLGVRCENEPASFDVADATALRAVGLFLGGVYASCLARFRLEQRERFMQMVVDHLPSYIYVKDCEGRFLLANRALAQSHGLADPVQMLGKNDFDFFDESMARPFFEAEQQMIQSGLPLHNRIEQARDEAGERIWVMSTKVPLLDDRNEVSGLVGIGTDVTAQRSVEEQLQESEDRFRVISESASEAILMQDMDRRIRYANAAATRMFGCSMEDLLGHSQEEFVEEPKSRRHSLRAGGFQQGRRSDGTSFPVEVSASRVKVQGEWHVVSIIRDVSEREQAMKETRELTAAIEQSEDGFIISDAQGQITYVNPGYELITGYRHEEAVGKRWVTTLDHPPSVEGGDELDLLDPDNWKLSWVAVRKDGSSYDEDVSTFPVFDAEGELCNFVTIIRDVSEERALEAELRNAQKLESVGQLAAGIAHEINTPIQFVGDNILFMKESIGDLLALQDLEVLLLEAAKAGAISEEQIRMLDEEIEAADLEYLAEEFPKAIEQSMEGVKRVSTIVRAMKEFAHPGAKEKVATNLNEAIETTVTVARNEWKYVSQLSLELDPDLPDVPCLVGEFNQVVLNLIVNARDAIAEKLGDSPGQGHIRIRTCRVEEFVEVQVSDDGGGIPEAIADRIFDPFFTTKEVGKGSGQGLAIAQGVIVKKHGGAFWFESEAGTGTTFYIRLPM